MTNANKLKTNETRLVTLSLVGTPVLIGALCLCLSVIINAVAG